MKDFFKKLTDKVHPSESTPPASDAFSRLNPNPAIAEGRGFSSTSPSQHAETLLLAGFFKTANHQWAPYHLTEREYQARALLTGGMSRPRRDNRPQTMPHPFMFGVQVVLLEAFANGQLAELKKLTQDYREGKQVFDYANGVPVQPKPLAVEVPAVAIAPVVPPRAFTTTVSHPVDPISPSSVVTPTSAPRHDTVVPTHFQPGMSHTSAPQASFQADTAVLERPEAATAPSFVAVAPPAVTSLAALLPALSLAYPSVDAPPSNVVPLHRTQETARDTQDEMDIIEGAQTPHALHTSGMIQQYGQPQAPLSNQ